MPHLHITYAATDIFRSSSCRFDSCSHLRVHSYSQLPPQRQNFGAGLHVLHRGHVLAIDVYDVAILCLASML